MKGKLLAVIGDEDTCTGFLLGGIGEINKQRKANYMVVDKDTPTSDIEDQLKFVSFLKNCCLFAYFIKGIQHFFY